MSLKILNLLVITFLFLSCSTKKEETQDIKTSIQEKLNIENINANHPNFDTLDVLYGKDYVDFSYQFLQTSKFKRHLNTMGLIIDPSNDEYIRRYSYSYKKAGEHQKAMQILQLAIDNASSKDELLGHLGYSAWNCLHFYRDYENTIRTVDEILKLTENDYGYACHGDPCLLTKGQALYKLGEYNKALKAFSKLQAYQESEGFDSMGNFLVVFYKARCLAEIKEFEEAISYFSHLIKDHPNAEASYQLAKIYMETEQIKQAQKQIALAEAALQKGFSFKEPYFERFDKVFQYQIDELKERMR